MKLSSVSIFTLMVLMLLSDHAKAQSSSPSFGDEDDMELRVDPEMEADAPETFEEEAEIRLPSFVKTLPISMNGDNWDELSYALKMGNRRVNIVHIGDSHLQADIATQQVRDFLQYDYGNAGRGLVAPLRLSGTNEPFNYAFRSDISWSPQRFMKYPWDREMGFTGCSLYSPSPIGDIEISTSDKLDYNPFSEIKLYHTGRLPVDRITDENGREIGFSYNPDSNGTQLILGAPVRYARIHVSGESPVTLFGALLLSNHPGVIYNVIGNNGATFNSYNRIDDFGKKLGMLDPDLIILSLGCNEAFGSFNSLTFLNQVDNLVRQIRTANPRAKILLITPIECHRRTRVANRHGRRKKSSSRTVFAVNRNIEPVRNALMSYARKQHIPVYDFYAAAGGAGAADRWVSAGLYSRDHIHLSAKGYHVQGKMLYEAIRTQLNKD